MTDIALLMENAMADAREAASTLARDFTDEDVSSGNFGDLMLAAEAFLKGGDFSDPKASFLRSVQTQYGFKGKISVKQARAVLNSILRPRGVRPASTPREERVYKCFKCDEELTGIDALNAHKQGHYATPEPTEGEAVIEHREQVLGISIEDIPDGYYALPRPESSINPWVFLRVKRTRQGKRRDRRYTFGKVRTGNEFVPAGTIEVAEWSSNSKRLCGEQKPGDCYRGEYEALFPMLRTAPEAWAKVFGQQMGVCGRCGKALTSEMRFEGFGAECIKHADHWTRKWGFAVKQNLMEGQNG